MSYLPIKIGGIVMYLYELIEKYGKGASNEKMKELTMILSDFLAPMKKVHKEKYWSLMRDVFGLLNDGHYDDKFSMHDVENIEYTDKQGAKHSGAYWSLEQAEEAMKKMQLPSDVNKYDFWVAINLSYSDLCKVLDDEQILKSACAFWFNDEDWPKEGKANTKVFDYMRCKHSK